MADRATLLNAERKALAFAEQHNFVGTDPYDGLLSPAARHLRGPRVRQAWVQAHKHLGSRTRKVTGVRPIVMTKALALFSQGATLASRPDLANRLLDRILQEKGAGPWGYEFDVQTRWAHYPAYSPNVVSTVFTLRAFAAANRLNDVSDDTLAWLTSLQDPAGYFRYTESSSRLIHNGSLLAAEGIDLLGGDRGMVADAVAMTVEKQAVDGSWPYGEGPGLEWIDSFHTIYNLDSLMFLYQRGYSALDAIKKGYTYWVEHCLSTRGVPLYFAGDSKESTDVHNVATSVGFLARMCEFQDCRVNSVPAISHLLSLQGHDGGFRNTPRSLPHMRWNQGHAYLALSHWLVPQPFVATKANDGFSSND
ncbi:hypothetical protein [Kocuria rosea]|uniref:hypothetical protein n=1 Tax=Kocuria rosea TaxID=1275 RepID=UPI001304FFF7|nr:hypothetical protein [Kocuria rosea]